MANGFPTRFLFINNIEFSATAEQIAAAVTNGLGVSSDFTHLIKVTTFKTDAKFNGKAVIEVVPPLREISESDFGRLGSVLRICSRRAYIKQDNGEARLPDGSFLFKNTGQTRVDGKYGSCLTRSKEKILESGFLTTLGITNEFKGQVFAGPFDRSLTSQLLSEKFRIHGPLKRDILLETRMVKTGYRPRPLTYVHAHYKFSLSAIQAVTTIHGVPILGSSLVPHAKFENQLKPLEVMSRGLGPNGILLDIEGEMETNGYIPITSTSEAILRTDISQIFGRCAYCNNKMHPMGFHPDFEYWLSYCNNCNPNKEIERAVKGAAAQQNQQIVQENSRVPMACARNCYQSYKEYKNVYAEFIKEERFADRQILSGLSQRVVIREMKVIDERTMFNENGESPEKVYDLLVYVSLDGPPNFDLQVHKCVKFQHGYQSFGKKRPWPSHALIVHSDDNGVVILRWENINSEHPQISEATLVPHAIEANYDAMRNALANLKDEECNKLFWQIIDPSCPHHQEDVSSDEFPMMYRESLLFNELNDGQRSLLTDTWKRRFSTAVGPPGTGKTFLIAVKAIFHALDDKKGKVLICTASNYAADNVAEKVSTLSAEFANEIRGISVTNDQPQDSSAFGTSEISMMRIYADARHSQTNSSDYAILHNLVQKELPSNRDYQVLLEKAGPKPAYEYNTKERRLLEMCITSIEDDLLSKSNILVSTIQTAARRSFNGVTTLILDEAGQVTDPLALVACYAIKPCPNHTFLVGDHKQLRPCVISNRAKRAGFDKSLLERHVAYRNSTTNTLAIQYRMHPLLNHFISKTFYGGIVKTDITVQNNLIQATNFNPILTSLAVSPLLFVNQEVYSERVEDTSFSNPGEARLILEVVKTLLMNKIPASSIGVLSFYDGQTRLIKQLLELPSSELSLQNGTSKVEVTNVDAFQGRECDVIIVSCTRRNDVGNIGFLRSPNRMNVALSRAKKCLLVVGSANTLELSKDALWKEFLNYCKENGKIIDQKLVMDGN